jgi:peptide chain release factor
VYSQCTFFSFLKDTFPCLIEEMIFRQAISQIKGVWLWDKIVYRPIMTIRRMISVMKHYHYYYSYSPSSSIHGSSRIGRCCYESTESQSKLKQWIDAYKKKSEHGINEQDAVTTVIKEPLKIEIPKHELVEKFIKGSGPGGQKINKTNSCVFLEHLPTGIQIKCQKTRSLSQNRREAQRELLLRLDEHLNGPLSKRSLRREREQRRERKHHQRVKLKYGASRTSSDQSSPSPCSTISSPLSENT